jgi:hypothetical protein
MDIPYVVVRVAAPGSRRPPRGHRRGGVRAQRLLRPVRPPLPAERPGRLDAASRGRSSRAPSTCARLPPRTGTTSRGRRSILENGDVRISLATVTSRCRTSSATPTPTSCCSCTTEPAASRRTSALSRTEPGDYLLVPRGTMHRLAPSTPTSSLVVEAFSEVASPTAGMLGQHALFDPAVIKVPSPDERRARSRPTRRRVRGRDPARGRAHQRVLPVLPARRRRLEGHARGAAAQRRDIRPVMSERYHLPPSAHATFVMPTRSSARSCRALENGDPSALKVPFYHSNIDYDEVLFYHAASSSAAPGSPGHAHVPPAGHPPRPAAGRRARRPRHRTEEIAVMLDTAGRSAPARRRPPSSSSTTGRAGQDRVSPPMSTRPKNPPASTASTSSSSPRPTPDALHRLLVDLRLLAHDAARVAPIDLYEQHDITLLVNRGGGLRGAFRRAHGPSITGDGLAVRDAVARSRRGRAGRTPGSGDAGRPVPAIVRHRRQPLYFVDGADAPRAGSARLRRSSPAGGGRRQGLPRHRSPHEQRRARARCSAGPSVLQGRVRLHRGPVLRHPRREDRPHLLRAALAVRLVLHPDQRGHRGEEPDQRVPRGVPRAGRPAPRVPHARHPGVAPRARRQRHRDARHRRRLLRLRVRSRAGRDGGSRRDRARARSSSTATPRATCSRSSPRT